MSLNLTFPPGRYVQGSLYKLNPSKDNNGQPKLDKEGKPVEQAYFAVAIPKNPGETAWWSSPWGQQVLAVGAAEMPNNYQHPQFAWKIEDGDSTIPNKRGRMNKDREGFPGNWIIKFSSSFLPDICTLLDPSRAGKPVRVMTDNFIQAGSYIQVAATIQGNKRTDSPGIYINPNIACLVGYGPVIAFGMDPDDAGFGAAPLPAGASATPLGVTTAPVAAPIPMAGPAAPMMPPTPAVPVAPMAQPVPAAPAIPAAPMPAPVAVQPHPTILQAPAAPPPPAAPVAPIGRQMTAKATAPYEAYIQSGWTDAQLVQQGLMIA